MQFKKKLLLIDGHALLYRAFHAIPNMAADYKAHRKPQPDELTLQLPKLKEILAALDIPVYEKAGYEADDLLGIISHKTPKDVLNMIVTGDMDLLQLVDNRTHVYRFKIGFSEIQIFDIDKMAEVYRLHPTQWVDYKAIRGDTSDNIPGVPGICEKGGLELVQVFGSLDGVYEAVEKQDKRIKAGTLKKLIAGKDKAYLSYKLAHIDQKNHLDFDFDRCLLDEYNQPKALELMHALSIKALDSKIPGGLKVALVASRRGDDKKPNALIKTEEQALLAAYLANPGQRNYETSDWKYLAEQLEGKNLVKIYQEIELPLMAVLAKMHERGIK